MKPFMEQLHDIEGLDPISWWPLAIGWWILILVGISIFLAIACYATYYAAFRRSWKNDTLQKLTHLETNLTNVTARETMIFLSEYLRRITLRRFSREECAGLIGEEWLKWLSMHDPKKFDWEKKGALLIDIPYAPVDKRIPVDQIKILIHAVRHWVR